MMDRPASRIKTVAGIVALVGAVWATMAFVPKWDHGVEISLKAEPVLHIGHYVVTNTILASTFVVLMFALFAWAVYRKRNDPRSRLFAFVEMLIEGLFGLVERTVGRNVAPKVFPIVATFLLFILANNWFGITPVVGSIGIWESKAALHGHASHGEESKGQDSKTKDEQKSDVASPEPAVAPETDMHAEPAAISDEQHEGANISDHEAADTSDEHADELIFVPLLRSANSDLNMTLAIALVSVTIIQVIAIRTIGFRPYLRKYINFSGPIMFAVGLLEIVSEVVKIFSFAFRLFGNIFAGDVLLIVISSLLPFAGPIPFIAIELFAGMVQALVFSMLTMVFLKSHLSHAEHAH